jgi:hypothetical protein
MKIGLRAATPTIERQDVPATLKAAFDAAIGFPTNRAMTLQPSTQTLKEKANEETSFGRIIVDENGLTAGTHLYILEPARALLAEWKEARRSFDVAIEPMMSDINAVRNLDHDVEALSARRNQDIAQAEQEFGKDHRYQQIQDAFGKAESRYKRLEQANGNRAANMATTGVPYWIGLLCLGGAEWLINYDIFL